MVSEKMWRAIGFFTRLFPPNILKFDQTSKCLVAIPERKHRRWLAFYFMYSIPYIFGVLTVATHRLVYVGVPDHTKARHIIGICLNACIVSLYLICFHTILLNDGTFYLLFNSCSIFRQTFPDIQQKNKRHPKEKIVEYTLLFFPSNLIMTLVLCTGYVMLKVDLLYVLVNYLYPHRSATFNLILLIPRYLHVASVSYLMFVFIIGTLEFALLELYVASYSFYHFNVFVDSNLGCKNYYKSNRNFGQREKMLDVPMLLHTYTRAKLMEKVADETYFYFLPFLLLLGGSILIATTFATVRLYHVIEKPYYFAMPFLSLTVFIVILALFPAASAVNDESTRVLKNISSVLKRNGCLGKKLRAQRPFRFIFGPFFYAKKSTKMTFMRCVFDRILECLLLYK